MFSTFRDITEKHSFLRPKKYSVRPSVNIKLFSRQGESKNQVYIKKKRLKWPYFVGPRDLLRGIKVHRYCQFNSAISFYFLILKYKIKDTFFQPTCCQHIFPCTIGWLSGSCVLGWYHCTQTADLLFFA